VTAPDDLLPFLRFTAQPTRPLGAALPVLVTPEVTSPWTPRVIDAPPAVAAPPAVDLASAADEARARGRAEGLEDTAALRAQLVEVIDQLVSARAAIAPPTAEVIAEVCGCVIEGWLAVTDRQALLAPIVAGWLAASDQPAAVRVHPDDVAAITALIGEAPLAIVADPALAPGALAIRGAALEVSHDWRARLPELRTAIAAALTPDAGADA
jgi:flagellar biosynthesis/type III secretory pathway protein FliH